MKGCVDEPRQKKRQFLLVQIPFTLIDEKWIAAFTFACLVVYVCICGSLAGLKISKVVCTP
jgi:hypothetical protein